MFAVIKTGGKQYKVAEGDEIVIEKLAADAGDSVTFDSVLMLGDGKKVTIGEPVVSGASVVGTVAEQRKGAKVLIMKKRQRNTYRRKKGHRQLETVVTIDSILADGKKAPAKKAAPKKEAAPAKEAAPKATAKKPAAKKDEAAKPAAKKAAPKKEAAPAKADDLTKMKGLGKVFAGKLEAEGITTFAQIAKMKKADVEALEEKIGASGKFESNDWVAQAKELAKG
ncbi:MAG: 50S ribosomal protein L21 [Henriciella sp.]|nr:50S ribosomal protein L21 [Henriciella sp.]MBO6694953.1 50S ribosomal protein L21 [Henriciella sp.]